MKAPAPGRRCHGCSAQTNPDFSLRVWRGHCGVLMPGRPLIKDPQPGGGGGFGALASCSPPTHEPTTEMVSAGETCTLLNTMLLCRIRKWKMWGGGWGKAKAKAHPTPPRLTPPHLTSPHLHLTSPHLTSPHLTSPHLTSPHLTSPRLASPHLTSPHLTSPHLTSPHPGDLAPV